MRISELEISGGIEFEGTNYRYWDFEVDDIAVKVAEFALQKALLPDYRETKYKNHTAESLDPLNNSMLAIDGVAAVMVS